VEQIHKKLCPSSAFTYHCAPVQRVRTIPVRWEKPLEPAANIIHYLVESRNFYFQTPSRQMIKMIMMTVKPFIHVPSESSALWPITNKTLVQEDNVWGKEQSQRKKYIYFTWNTNLNEQTGENMYDYKLHRNVWYV
jgi:hypothetical protein